MSQPAPAVLSVLHKCVVLGVAGEHAQTVPEFSAVVSGQISTGVTAAPTRPRPSTERIRVCLRMATGSVPALQLMRVGPAVTLIFLRALNNFLKRPEKKASQELSLGVDRAGDVLVGMCGCGCVSRSSWLPTANRLSWPSFRDVPRAHAPPSCEGSPVTPTPREELAACAIAIRAGARGPTIMLYLAASQASAYQYHGAPLWRRGSRIFSRLHALAVAEAPPAAARVGRRKRQSVTRDHSKREDCSPSHDEGDTRTCDLVFAKTAQRESDLSEYDRYERHASQCWRR